MHAKVRLGYPFAEGIPTFISSGISAYESISEISIVDSYVLQGDNSYCPVSIKSSTLLIHGNIFSKYVIRFDSEQFTFDQERSFNEKRNPSISELVSQTDFTRIISRT